MTSETHTDLAHHPDEVLRRVRAVRNGCDAILEGKFPPTVDTLGGLILVLTKAMQWQAGEPPAEVAA